LYNDYESDGKRPLGRSRLNWEDIIKIDLQISEKESMHWIDLTQNRNKCWALMNAVKNFRFP
jgi:hypothetical protein